MLFCLFKGLQNTVVENVELELKRMSLVVVKSNVSFLYVLPAKVIWHTRIMYPSPVQKSAFHMSLHYSLLNQVPWNIFIFCEILLSDIHDLNLFGDNISLCHKDKRNISANFVYPTGMCYLSANVVIWV